MRLLRLSPGMDLHIPSPFLSGFAPAVEHIGRLPHDCAGKLLEGPFLSQRFLMGGGLGHVRYTLDDPLPRAVTVDQIHSDIVVDIEHVSEKTQGDGIFFVEDLRQSSRRGGGGYPALVLGTRTADCTAVAVLGQVGPFLVGGICHAGWRGYVEGIHLKLLFSIKEKLEDMSHGNAKRAAGGMMGQMEVHISPAIFGVSYECGCEVLTAIERHHQNHLGQAFGLPQIRQAVEAGRNVQTDPALVPLLDGRQFRSDRCYPDLQLLVACDLSAIGVPEDKIQVFRENTWSAAFLYSYRRAVLCGEETGRRLVTHLVVG